MHVYLEQIREATYASRDYDLLNSVFMRRQPLVFIIV